MSNSHLETIAQGTFIIPSARPSIHSHEGCPFANYNTRGKSRLNSRPTTNNRYESYKAGPSSESDRAGPSSESDRAGPSFESDRAGPSSESYRDGPTSESDRAGPSSESYRAGRSSGTASEIDEFDSVRSNSPFQEYSLANFPPSSYCNEDLDCNENQQVNSLASNAVSLNTRRSLNKKSSSPNRRPTGHCNIRGRKIKSSLQSYAILIFAVIFGFAWCNMDLFSIAQKGYNICTSYDQSTFYNDLNEVGKKYGISEDSILRVQSGISTIFEKQDAGSIIFVYDSKLTEFNEFEFNELINDIANIAAKYLRNDSTSVYHAVGNISSFDEQTHCKEVAKTGVTVVRELEQGPSDLAMAFHYCCHEDNPFIKKSAIFFTLDIATCSTYSGGQNITLYKIIEKCLTKKWHKMGPLATKLVVQEIMRRNVLALSLDSKILPTS